MITVYSNGHQNPILTIKVPTLPYIIRFSFEYGRRRDDTTRKPDIAVAQASNPARAFSSVKASAYLPHLISQIRGHNIRQTAFRLQHPCMRGAPATVCRDGKEPHGDRQNDWF